MACGIYLAVRPRVPLGRLAVRPRVLLGRPAVRPRVPLGAVLSGSSASPTGAPIEISIRVAAIRIRDLLTSALV